MGERSVALLTPKKRAARRGEWFAECERIAFGRHLCGAAIANPHQDAKNMLLQQRAW
jgi:hypothetical protein